MRPGIIIAIVAAVVIVIGGVWWYNQQAEQARIEQERAEQIAQEEELARQEAEAAAAEQAALEAEEAERAEAEALAAEEAALAEEEAPAAEEAALAEEETPVAEDDPIVVGDEITEDAIVVESPTDPVILDADAAATVELVDEAEPAETVEAEPAETVAALDPDTVPAAEAPATEPEELLTPANFDREEVLVLIDTSEQLTPEERSTLRALVEGAVANPDMLEPAIASIRDALDLPPLN